MTKRMRNTKNNIPEQVYSAPAIAIMAVALIVVAIIAAALIMGIVNRFDPVQNTIKTQHALTMAPINTLVAISWKVALSGLGIYAIVSVLMIALTWLKVQASTVHAKNGLYPLIVTPNGAYDPNRAMGEHPTITLAALNVQKQAALGADKISYTLKDSGELPALEDVTADIPTLPNLIPLSEVNHAFTLDNIVIGQNAQRENVGRPLSELMHLLTVGASGWGKSGFLRYILYQLANTRDEFDVMAIDVSGSEFNILTGWERLRYPVARTIDDACEIVAAFSAETERRSKLYENYPMAYDLDSYNQLAAEPLQPQIMIIDEGTTLLSQPEIGQLIKQAVCTCRQYGQYVIMTGQSAKASVLDTASRDNFSSRLCFHAPKTSVRVVMDRPLDEINTKGRAWVQLPGRDVEQVQVPLIQKRDLMNVLKRDGLERAKPAQPQTQVIEVEPENETDEDKIRRLAASGLSRSKIEKAVFGHTGGNAFKKVKAILG